MNLATLLEGPCNVKHRGQVFHFRGGLTVTPLRDLLVIDTDVYGPIAQRALDRSFAIAGTPIGVWTDEQLAVTHRWNNPTIGSLVTPRYDILSVTAATDVIVLVGDAEPRAGCPVRIIPFRGATLPAGSAEGTLYYWGANGKLYNSEANAVAGGATGVIDITDAGTGDFGLIEQEYIQIDALTANRRITFHNGAVIGMPAAAFSAIQSALGAMSFGLFPKEGSSWDDANNVYTITKVALTDTPPDADEIPTQEYTAEFGADPWDEFQARGPITIVPTLRTEPIVTDALGLVGMKIAGLDVSATLAPEGFTEAQMLDLLTVQGGTAARGGNAVRGDLIVAGTGVYAALYNGAPRQLPQTFAATAQRAGELEIRGVRTPGSAAFFFGEAEPS
jgi:hypothetical protein